MNIVNLSPDERLTADIVDIKRWIREMKLDPSGGGAASVSSVFGRTGAVVAATNDYTWAQINKATSSLADITTRSAADLSSGTLPDARLSSNVALLATAQALTNKDLTGVGNTFPTLNQDTTGKAAKADALNSATTIVNVAAATAPSLGQVLTATDSTHATWQTPSAGAGDMLKATYDPANIAQQLVGTTAAQTLSSKTLSTPTINGVTLGYLLKTANFTVTSAAVTYAVDASGAARTATMISPTGIAGRFYMFKKVDSSANAVTINPAAAETFDGASSIVLDKQYQSVMLMSDGTNWIVLRPRTAAGTGITVTNSGGVNTVAIDSTVATLTGTQALTNKDLTGAGNTFPTLNQSTTGSAATLTTPRNIAGVAFDGSAAISIPHANLTSLPADDHPQYPLGAGRGGSQTLNGGVGVSNILILSSTAHATKGIIYLSAVSSGGPYVNELSGSYMTGFTTAISPSAGFAAQTTTAATSPAGTHNRYAVYLDTGAAVASGKVLGSVSFGGAADSIHSLNSSAYVAAFATELWSATALGSALAFYTTPNTTATPAIAFGIDNDKTITMPKYGTGLLHSSSAGVISSALVDLAADITGVLPAGNVATLNQNTTGSAAKLTTARAIYGNNFDGTADLAQIIASTYGGTGNGFTKFSGPATTEKTFTLPNATATILTSADTTGTGTTAVLSGSPTIVTPTIASHVNAQHNHQNAAGGGALDAAAISTGVLAIGRLATGTPDGTKYVRDDGTLATPAGAGDMSKATYDPDTTSQVITRYVAKSADYTLTATDYHVHFSASGAARTATLPTAVGAAGRRYVISKSDSTVNKVTIATTSSQTIDGGTTLDIINQHQAITVQSDGANWVIVAIAPGLWQSVTATSSGCSSYVDQLITYMKLGRVMHVVLSLNGTSNSAAFTVTLPFAAAVRTLVVLGASANNSAGLTTPGAIDIAASGTTGTLSKDGSLGGVWTASGSKYWYGSFTYPTST